jgi:hypothetical protein
MPEPGEYLLTNVGFDRSDLPYISVSRNDEFLDIHPLGQTITITMDASERFCAGWTDITNGDRFTCPDNKSLDHKYEQCPACQQRRGFNPAYYHADSVSEQQEARNLQPHILYLAHFGKGTIKVGISLAARRISRLLEQGARTALILGTFPTAHIARQYEARIAALPQFAETIQLRKKIAGLSEIYDSESATAELLSARSAVEQALHVTLDQEEPLICDTFFFPEKLQGLEDAVDCSPLHAVSGKVVGMLGSFLFCQYDDEVVFLPLKKYVGYKFALTDQVSPLQLPARQTSLF